MKKDDLFTMFVMKELLSEEEYTKMAKYNKLEQEIQKEVFFATDPEIIMHVMEIITKEFTDLMDQENVNEAEIIVRVLKMAKVARDAMKTHPAYPRLYEALVVSWAERGENYDEVERFSNEILERFSDEERVNTAVEKATKTIEKFDSFANSFLSAIDNKKPTKADLGEKLNKLLN